MIRLVSSRRLQQLEARTLAAEAQITRGLALENELRKRLDLLKQAHDFHKQDAAEWKGRASRLIDQVGITTGALQSPAMDPDPSPQRETRRVMAALGRTSLSPKNADPEPSSPSAEILGVDAAAAAAAIAGVMN